MQPIPLVRGSAFLPFFRFLRQIGAPVDQTLNKVMLPRHALFDPESLVPLNQAFAFLDRSARAEGLRNLGLLVGQETRVPDLGAFGQMVRRSHTLHDALARAARVTSLYNSGQRIWVVPSGDQVRVCFAYTSNMDAGQQYGEQFTLMLLIDCIRMAAGPRWWPAEIHVGAAGGNMGDWSRDLSASGVSAVSSEVSAVVINRALLSVPLHTSPPVEDQSQAQALTETAPAADFLGSAEQLVRIFLPEGGLAIARLAAIAGMSPRTFQRRLAEAGVSYSDLVDVVRFKSAVGLIDDRSAKLIDIAYELGYSDAANFTRAFRRWTGIPPSEFRHFRAEVLPGLVQVGAK